MRSMAPRYFTLLILPVVLSLETLVEKPPPNFSDCYTVKGMLYIPYAEIREPFYAWYDLKLGSSRIDYYGGMVKTYQLSKASEYGTSLKVAPITTETEENVDTCLQVNGTIEMRIKPQSMLPDLTGFKLIGEEVLDGLTCEKWRLVDVKGDKVNKYTMWIRYKKSHKYPKLKAAIPVKYEMRGYNSLIGSHFDHYYLEYEWYSYEEPRPEVFQLCNSTYISTATKNNTYYSFSSNEALLHTILLKMADFDIVIDMTCTSFPGPGEEHIYSLNPMKEFIDNYEDHLDTAFEKFKKRHKKNYIDNKEHFLRKQLFRQNMRFIASKNRAGLGFKLGVNHLADKNNAELRVLRGRQYSAVYNGGQSFPYTNSSDIVRSVPDSLDWRLYGAVTPVKDQSVCGSCWSFGTTGTIEGAYFLKYGHQVRLSQQALIDCSWGFGNNGCDGGEDFRSYQWMMKHGGIPLEDEYGGYLGQDGYCHVDNVTLVAKIKGYVNVTSGDADALKVAVAKHGPISVAIDASHKTFSFYANGIYYEPQCGNKPEQLDHAVLVVGYGAINGEPYWLVKNSWSNYWGNDGYVLMAQKNNNCGVETDPTYVIM